MSREVSREHTLGFCLEGLVVLPTLAAVAHLFIAIMPDLKRVCVVVFASTLRWVSPERLTR